MPRLKPHLLPAAAVGLALALLAGCAAPTPPPGAFETALAATVAVGSTAIAQGFSDNRATLTAGAPTATDTAVPSATPSQTPVPTETATATETAAPSETPTPQVSPTHTLPPPPPPTATASAPLAGTYTQNGVCLTQAAYTAPYWNSWRYTRSIVGNFRVCVPSVTLRPSGELQVNISWYINRDGFLPEVQLDTRDAQVEPYNGSALYLEDSGGQRYFHTEIQGAANEGGSGPMGSSILGYYLFPAVRTTAGPFTLVDTHRLLRLANIALTGPVQ